MAREKIIWENGSRGLRSVHAGPGTATSTPYWTARIAVCWKADTGKEVWKGRLRGIFTASPVLVGGNIFATNETGRTFIFAATPKAFTLIGENQLGDEVMATPTFCGDCIYLRVANKSEDKRQEMLYCVGQSK